MFKITEDNRLVLPESGIVDSYVENDNSIEFYDDEDNKVGYANVKCGILYCYPVVENETQWGEQIYFHCFEDADSNLKSINSSTHDEMIQQCKSSLNEYFESWLEENYDYAYENL